MLRKARLNRVYYEKNTAHKINQENNQRTFEFPRPCAGPEITLNKSAVFAPVSREQFGN